MLFTFLPLLPLLPLLLLLLLFVVKLVKGLGRKRSKTNMFLSESVCVFTWLLYTWYVTGFLHRLSVNYSESPPTQNRQ